MCRLFLCMNRSPQQTRCLLDRFFHISSIGDEDLGQPNVDGYGIVSLQTRSSSRRQTRRRRDRDSSVPLPQKRWYVHKAPYSYLHDPKFDSVISTILTKAAPSSKPIVLAQTRLFDEEYSTIDSIPTNENTPPYVYRSSGAHPEQHIFFHNGQINNFKHYQSIIVENIAPKYRSKIRGKTDSEYMFYLYLTFLDAAVEAGGMGMVATMSKEKRALLDMIDFFKQHHMNIVLNLLYANTRKILVSRILIGKNKLPPLFAARGGGGGGDSGVLVTSRKISRDQHLVKSGEIMEFEI